MVSRDGRHAAYETTAIAGSDGHKLRAREPGARPARQRHWVRDGSRGEQAFRSLVAEIGDERHDLVDSDGDTLLVRTTRSAPNGRLLRVDASGRGDAVDDGAARARRDAPGGRLFASYL